MRRVICGLIALMVLSACSPEPAPIPSAPQSEIATEPTEAAALPPQTPVGGCQPDEGTEVDEASVLVPGPIHDLPASTAVGERLVIIITLLDADCQPAAGASVSVWHTDAD